MSSSRERPAAAVAAAEARLVFHDVAKIHDFVNERNLNSAEACQLLQGKSFLDEGWVTEEPADGAAPEGDEASGGSDASSDASGWSDSS